MSLTVENLKFSYRGFPVLKGVDFALKQGNLVCALGKNGAGKSTLFRCILGSLSKYSGTIRIYEKDVRTYAVKEMAENVAYIPQSHQSVYNYSVVDMILMGTTASLGTFASPGREQKERVEEAMELVGITYMIHRTFGHISGGEQQLVLIARAIAQQAKILIMDEPCANLDYGNQIRMMELLKKLANKGYLIVQATHNPEHALLYGDQVLVLSDGKIQCQGAPQQVLTEAVLQQIYGIPIGLYDMKRDGRKICVPVV